MKRKANTLAKLPRLRSDGQAEQFIARSDLTQFDFSTLKPTQFEFSDPQDVLLATRSKKHPKDTR